MRVLQRNTVVGLCPSANQAVDKRYESGTAIVVSTPVPPTSKRPWLPGLFSCDFRPVVSVLRFIQVLLFTGRLSSCFLPCVGVMNIFWCLFSTAMASQRGAANPRNPPPPAEPPVGADNAFRAPPAPEQLASFNRLLDKVVTAGLLCRYARHVELAGRAGAQAEALYTEDSLLVGCLRGYEARALWNLSCEAGSKMEEDALKRRAWALLRPLHALVLRRLAANTLLPGTVRQEESEY